MLMPPETCLTCRYADMNRAIAKYGENTQSAYCAAPNIPLDAQCTTRPITWACDKGKWQRAETAAIAARERRIRQPENPENQI